MRVLCESLAALGWWLFPGRCVLCELPSGRRRDLCPWCEDDLPRVQQPCTRCALPVTAASGRCGPCAAATPAWHAAVCALHYSGDAARMINRLKHRGALHHARVLAALLADSIEANRSIAPDSPPAALVPVPLHPRRERARGLDQAAEIAQHLGRRLEIPVLHRAVRRIRDTPPQQSLGRRARLGNLRGAFLVRGNPLPEHVAIVDDVLTTGTTAGVLARVLLASGARRVEVWAVARAVAHALPGHGGAPRPDESGRESTYDLHASSGAA